MTKPVPVLVLASTKGGVGKTTIAYCLATELARRTGEPVECIDAERRLLAGELLDGGGEAAVAHLVNHGK